MKWSLVSVAVLYICQVCVWRCDITTHNLPSLKAYIRMKSENNAVIMVFTDFLFPFFIQTETWNRCIFFVIEICHKWKLFYLMSWPRPSSRGSQSVKASDQTSCAAYMFSSIAGVNGQTVTKWNLCTIYFLNWDIN